MFSASYASRASFPHWSRDSTLDKTRYPRPLALNQDLSLPPIASDVPGTSGGTREVDPYRKINILEKNIKFLQEQHAETLEKLHNEIDILRRENKDLHYKLIMDQRIYRSDSISGLNASHSASKKSRSGSSEKSEGQAQSQCTNYALTTAAEEEQTATLPNADNRQTEQINIRGKVVDTSHLKTPLLPSDPGNEFVQIVITSLNPLHVCTNYSQPPRPPTLQECEAIIHNLYNSNQLLAQKLFHLKTCMRDLVNTKWTSETQQLAKTYLSDYPREREAAHFSKAPLRSHPKRVVQLPVTTAEKVTLPALKQTLGSSFAERQKRTQAVQKSRLRRAVL
ncbi:coiled-coil domain-containing protein 74B [Protopterus annectens]|uniref:coiled-coil domain-containing protein 74B n=1 Tax=Protopterus annectens TaxID=7888 RepID=UPI001CFBE2AB|nr:coiled-coil domain-containing protein 74B [Protopterus annectens]